jgi:quercetin dioxygenase-like cupin family protein
LSKENIFFSQKKEIDKTYFRGEVFMTEVLNKNNSVEHEMYHVLFKNGALTTLHYHETEQILIVTKGMGILCLFEDNIIENLSATAKTISLDEGDVVSIPPLIWHFHGSLKDDFAHIALRNRYRIDSTGKKQQANNVWEKDFLNQLTHLNTNEFNQLSRQIDQKIKVIVQGELEKLEIKK